MYPLKKIESERVGGGKNFDPPNGPV